MTVRLLAVGACIAGLGLMSVAGHAEGYEGNDRELHNEVYPKAYRHGKHHSQDGYRFVYAESERGFQRVVAPVRRAEHGDQVRLPGGTWVYCEYSCEYTLRRQSLDFWDSFQGGSGVSPHVLYWEFGIGHESR